MPIDCAGLTDVGRKRDHNEDALLLVPASRLFVVADGMGGHEAGEVASNIAISTLESFFAAVDEDPESTWPYATDPDLDEAGNRLSVAIRLANQNIRGNAAGRGEGRSQMGTTCVALLVNGTRAYFAWVGDSRGYLWRRGELKQITTDHSLLNDLLRTGRIRPEDLPNFQHKNVITRALGMADEVQVDVENVELQDGDVLLACSDGLSGMVEDERLATTLDRDTPLEKLCQRLIDAANAAGGNDNITVALARYTA